MSERIRVGTLSVAEPLYRFVEDEALPGTGVDRKTFWAGAEAIFHDLMPHNRELLATRDKLQARLDEYHRAEPGLPEPAARGVMSSSSWRPQMMTLAPRASL